MGTLIVDYDGKRTTKSSENVIVLKLCSKNNCVGGQSFHLHPFSGIINSN
jgi:hypothetical protein